jgi:glycosyltransferase involved in cell wall biosynthesis
MSNGRWKKKIAWWLFQHRDLLTSTAFHATGHQEANDLRKLGFKQPIAVIPNGITLPAVMPQPPRMQSAHLRPKRCLFLSRIHPKKGLLNLLHAWKEVMQNENWKLVLAGPDENGHQREVQLLADSLELTEQIEFTGSVTDQEKWHLYCKSDLFVLPSFSENFGIVIAEALAAGLPVITTTPTPWQVLEERSLGWWVDPEIPALADALRAAIQLSDTERVAMGNAGAIWAKEQFGWDGIAEQMIEFYQWLLNPNKPQPDFVV